jgi:dynactin complex subunit
MHQAIADMDSPVKPDPEVLQLESRVACTKSGLRGVVRFLGGTEFAEGLWCGIELDTPGGKHDGMVQGKRYFSTKEANRGIFVRPEAVRLVGDRAESKTPSIPNATKTG